MPLEKPRALRLGPPQLTVEWTLSSDHGPLVWADVGPSGATSTIALLGTPARADSFNPGTKGSRAGVSVSRDIVRDRQGTVTREGSVTCLLTGLN